MLQEGKDIFQQEAPGTSGCFCPGRVSYSLVCLQKRDGNKNLLVAGVGMDS